MDSALSFKKTSLLSLNLFISSCAWRKDIVYYQDIDSVSSKGKSNSYKKIIQPDDKLMIIVSAQDPGIAASFNLMSCTSVNPNKQEVAGTQNTQLYLVDANGFIDFPILGQLKVGGITKSQVLQLLKDKISIYIKSPIINLRIMNFKISAQGKVTMSETYTIPSERVTLIKALSIAKDLTIYGKRDNILIIREIDGVKTYSRVDITKAIFLNSPFYYLAENDVVYVEPNKNKINGSAVVPNTRGIMSITSLLITLITLIVTTAK